MDKGARNDLSAAVPKFCLALEEYRRTPEGRVRTSQDFLATFFPHDDKGSTDKVFKYLPNEVRGPIVAAWGIRGMKAALRDTDDRAQQVVYDALIAGDVDHQAFEDGLGPETLVRWVPLADLWSFWRQGKLSKQAIHKAMATAYELYLFDARWFLETLTAKGGTLKGTDVLADGLTKDDLTQWVRRIHETGDGTPKGIVAALGWDKIVAKTSNDVLVSVLDAVVTKVGLVVAGAKDSSPRLGDASAPKAETKPEPPPVPAPGLAASASPAPAASSSSSGATSSATAPLSGGMPISFDLPKAEAPKSPDLPKPPGIEPRPTDKPAGDDTTWSMPPGPPDPAPSSSLEDGINVVVDDEADLSDKAAPPTAPRILAATPAPPEDDDTEIKQVPRRSERPPVRPPGGRSSR